jgi:ADP-ribosylation factor GTPase-activating protein 2/3
LGAKKTQKLGAKKVTAGDGIDFEEAERKAKEEADRIAKLGYDPDADELPKATTSAAADKSSVVSPTPLSPGRQQPSFGSTQAKGHERSKSEMERLGMGVARLGFGQVGSSKPAPKKMGFGAVGAPKTTQEGMHLTETLRASFPY